MKSRLALPHEPEPKCGLMQELAKSNPDPKEIARLSDALLDKAAAHKVFDLIYDCSVYQVAAKGLIDRMLDRLSRS